MALDLDLTDSALVALAADLLYDAGDPRATPWPDPATLGRIRSHLRGLADHLHLQEEEGTPA